MSQSCATKALQQIKDILEQQLFNRTNWRMHTTVAGEYVIRYERAILTQAGNLQDELDPPFEKALETYQNRYDKWVRFLMFPSL